MKAIFLLNDIDFMLKVYALAKERGKKPGDSVQDEFDELLKDSPGAVTFLGQTEKELDVFVGDLREDGVKVTYMTEIERQKKLKKEN